MLQTEFEDRGIFPVDREYRHGRRRISRSFRVLSELASVSVEDGARLRVLFVVPEMSGPFVPVIEEARLPYVLRPIPLHRFLEKVSDLLG